MLHFVENKLIVIHNLTIQVTKNINVLFEKVKVRILSSNLIRNVEIFTFVAFH